jgi:predicted nuclease of predicted toxin-antitoxin system
VIFTHDLDFGAILALTQAESPSVIQLRSQDILPENNTSLIVKHLEKYQGHLQEGALVVIDKNRSRVRILPLRR